MSALSKLERDILAFLEEAGEEHISSLLNTAKRCRGSADEVHSYRGALKALIDADLIELARDKGKRLRKLISLPKSESLLILADLDSHLKWSISDQLWQDVSPSPGIDVVITDAGMTAALEIL